MGRVGRGSYTEGMGRGGAGHTLRLWGVGRIAYGVMHLKYIDLYRAWGTNSGLDACFGRGYSVGRGTHDEGVAYRIWIVSMGC